MKKSLLFMVLSITLLTSILSFSTNMNAVYAEVNQTGTENEVEVEADIEQENKCKKDTECENENELNNQLDITTTTGQQSASLTVKKEIFGCDIPIDDTNIIGIDCVDLINDSPEWISCGDTGSIEFATVCGNIEENLFDIEVLDGQNTRVGQFTGSTQGTIIEGIEPGTYAVNEIIHPEPPLPPLPRDQLIEFPLLSQACTDRGFSDGGALITGNPPFFAYNICIEYEDEQGNDCSQTSVNAGENTVCTVKNYILQGIED